jgi:hypothetical protein
MRRACDRRQFLTPSAILEMFIERPAMQYRSSIDAGQLTRAAQKELALADPPVSLAFLLALGAGLRRGEIDRLEWAAFQWNHNVIRIEDHTAPRAQDRVVERRCPG